MTVLLKPRYETILPATAPSNYDQRTCSVFVTLPSYVPETSTSSLSTSTPFGFRPKTSTFGPKNDMEAILRGAWEIGAFKQALAGNDRIAVLESEPAGLYESYERLAEVHPKTWSGMVGMVLEDENKGVFSGILCKWISGCLNERLSNDLASFWDSRQIRNFVSSFSHTSPVTSAIFIPGPRLVHFLQWGGKMRG